MAVLVRGGIEFRDATPTRSTGPALSSSPEGWASRPQQRCLDAIVYRSRTTPETSFNAAFFAGDAFATESWVLADRTDILVDLVLNQDFTVNWEL
jgi:hypothetical protein